MSRIEGRVGSCKRAYVQTLLALSEEDVGLESQSIRLLLSL